MVGSVWQKPSTAPPQAGTVPFHGAGWAMPEPLSPNLARDNRPSPLAGDARARTRPPQAFPMHARNSSSASTVVPGQTQPRSLSPSAFTNRRLLSQTEPSCESGDLTPSSVDVLRSKLSVSREKNDALEDKFKQQQDLIALGSKYSLLKQRRSEDASKIKALESEVVRLRARIARDDCASAQQVPPVAMVFEGRNLPEELRNDIERFTAHAVYLYTKEGCYPPHSMVFRSKALKYINTKFIRPPNSPRPGWFANVPAKPVVIKAVVNLADDTPVTNDPGQNKSSAKVTKRKNVNGKGSKGKAAKVKQAKKAVTESVEKEYEEEDAQELDMNNKGQSSYLELTPLPCHPSFPLLSSPVNNDCSLPKKTINSEVKGCTSADEVIRIHVISGLFNSLDHILGEFHRSFGGGLVGGIKMLEGENFTGKQSKKKKGIEPVTAHLTLDGCKRLKTFALRPTLIHTTKVSKGAVVFMDVWNAELEGRMSLPCAPQRILGLVFFGGSLIQNDSLVHLEDRQHAIKGDASLTSLIAVRFNLDGLDPTLVNLLTFPGTAGSKRVANPQVLNVVNFLLSTGRFEITRGVELCRQLSTSVVGAATEGGVVVYSIKDKGWDIIHEYEHNIIKEMGCKLLGTFPRPKK